MDSKLRSNFWNEGYLIGNLNLPKRILKAALTEVTDLDFRPIVGEVYEEARDPNRLQVNIKSFGAAMLQIHKRMKRIIGLSEAQWYTKRELWTALKSLSGGLRQDIHRDYPSFETGKVILEKGVVQASVIVALMPNTHFVIYPGCFGTYTKSLESHLRLERLLLFRGDLVHASAEYKRMNIRLHCYVRVRGIKQNPDSTEAVVFSSYMCEYCTMQCHSKLVADTCSGKINSSTNARFKTTSLFLEVH
ncbi:hypothetical protein PHMEG_00021684 [Phytophthora megakarya]|uniref:Uncharacterized protein n=1 Tax=Phytophthora megakarya TaxID=4795 RepID=A0A225VKL9_9STRA|nr:hypothetical protein PHMEG_00021684 [Phytophthora megakarya]